MKNETNENKHHIFTISEVRKKVIDIFGEPKTEFEKRMIERETNWAWTNLPKYKMDKGKHKMIHINAKKETHIMKYKLKNAQEAYIKNKTLSKKLAEKKERVQELLEEVSGLNSLVRDLKNREKQLQTISN
jgi:hypothetical protein